MTLHLYTLLPLLLIAGCACESGVGIVGDTGSDASLPDTMDTPADTEPGDIVPSIDGLGESGWHESSEHWCPGTPETMDPYDVWSTSGSVFVLTGYSYYDTSTGIGYQDSYIYRNGGTGWGLTFEEHSIYSGIFIDFTGLSEVELLLLENHGYSCDLTLIESGSQTCAFSESGNVQDVFVVTENLAYAIKDDRVIYFDGALWGPYPAAYTPYSVRNLWASETEIFCSGDDGTIISLEDGEWRIHDTRTLSTMGEIWGFGSDDVWVAGGDTGLMHWDGMDWETMTWPEAPRFDALNAIRGFWGSEDNVLFIYTGNYLIRHDDSGFSMLLDFWSDISLTIESIWGNSPEELFVAVSDSNYEAGCGSRFLLWFDGTEFHWF